MTDNPLDVCHELLCPSLPVEAASKLVFTHPRQLPDGQVQAHLDEEISRMLRYLCLRFLALTSSFPRGKQHVSSPAAPNTMWPSVSTSHLFAVGLLVTLAITVSIVSATTLADARPLRIHFKLKRNSMKMYGQSEFDVFANPIVSSDSTTVRYDGYATFVEDTTKHTIVMVDGIAYFVTSTTDGSETAECSSSSSLALLNYIIPALNEATAISSATVDDKKITCSSGDLFKVVLGDATFVLCASGSSGFIVYGSDLDISVKYLTSSVPISNPTVSDDAARDCERIVTPSSVTATTLSFLTGEPVSYNSSTQSLARYLGRYFSYAR